ncbi:hypothetical protein FB451DRAFT_1565316 [Mycena latifolia]|nr:hypothetical protein FB451DRAFT_1565316 [Mycena latifolia]
MRTMLRLTLRADDARAGIARKVLADDLNRGSRPLHDDAQTHLLEPARTHGPRDISLRLRRARGLYSRARRAPCPLRLRAMGAAQMTCHCALYFPSANERPPARTSRGRCASPCAMHPGARHQLTALQSSTTVITRCVPPSVSKMCAFSLASANRALERGAPLPAAPTSVAHPASPATSGIRPRLVLGIVDASSMLGRPSEAPPHVNARHYPDPRAGVVTLQSRMLLVGPFDAAPNPAGYASTGPPHRADHARPLCVASGVGGDTSSA